jgi:SNF2 family DNA or RNA helicase
LADVTKPSVYGCYPLRSNGSWKNWFVPILVISVHLLTVNLVQTLFAVTNWFWQTEDAQSPVLIIAPDVLVAENWINEILKFTKGLIIYNYTKSDVCLSFVNCPTGLITQRTSLQKIRTVSFSKLYTVVVTTYSQL